MENTKLILVRYIPGIAFLGVGVAALGAFYSAALVSLLGAILSAAASMVAMVEQNRSADELIRATKELAEANTKIANLATESLNSVTGGDSFADVGLVENVGCFAVRHRGSYVLRNLEIRFVNLNEFGPENLMAGQSFENLTTLSPNTIKILQTPIPDFVSDTLRFNFFFAADNGSWVQQLRIIKRKERFLVAKKITRWGPGQDQEVLLEEIDEGYDGDLPA